MMNTQTTVAAMAKKWLLPALLVLCLFALPQLGFSQTPPPPGPGGTGGNPDNAVPFDFRMTLVFLAAAIVFAVVIIRRRRHSAHIVTGK